MAAFAVVMFMLSCVAGDAAAEPPEPAAAAPVPAAGDLVTVTRTADDHTAGSLRHAIDVVNETGSADGATIVLAPGAYVLELCTAHDDDNAGGDLDLTRSGAVTLSGTGAGATIRQTCPDERVLDATGPTHLSLDNVTITGGNLVARPAGEPDDTARGGAVRAAGTVTLTHTTFVDNRAQGRDDRAVQASTLGAAAGGALSARGDVSISDSTFTRNVAQGGTATREYVAVAGDAHGGAVETPGTVALLRSTFTENEALGGQQANGGGFGLVGAGGSASGGAVDAGSLDGTEVTVNHNHALGASSGYFWACPPPFLCGFYTGFSGGTGDGGAFLVRGSASLQGLRGDGNEAFGGTGYNDAGDPVPGYASGGVLVAWRATSIDHALLTGNRSSFGGAVESSGELVLSAVEARNNGASSGGAFRGGALTILDSTISENQGSRGGAVDAATVFAVRSRFDGNVGRQGGAIATSGTLIARDSTFSHNRSSVQGGGLWSDGDITLDATTLFENTAGSDTGDPIGGGGVFTSHRLSARNSTFSGNAASRDDVMFPGGALWAADAALDATTMVANRGSSTIRTPTLALSQTVLARSSGPVCETATTAITSAGSNWTDDGSCILDDLSDRTGPEDLLLGALQDNGGPTATMLPGAGSPLIDAAARATCPAIDQREVPRPQGTACDIGAVEVLADGPIPASDLGVAVDGPAVAGTGTQADYRFTITAAGGTGYPHLIVTLPEGWKADTDAAPDVDPPGAAVCAAAGATVLSCTSPTGMAAGTPVTIVVPVHLPATAGQTTVRAHVSGPGVDGNLANNDASVTTTRKIVTDLAVTGVGMSSSAPPPTPGAPSTIVRGGAPQTVRIDVGDLGPLPLIAPPEAPVRVVTDLPAGFSIEPIAGAWSCPTPSGHVVCTFVGALTTSTLQLPLHADAGAALGGRTLSFTIEQDQIQDPHPANDTATLPLFVVPSGTFFHPLTPTRILDSRGPGGGWNGALAAGAPRSLRVGGGSTGLPSGLDAVVLNVTVTNPTANSFLTVYPAGTVPPTASNLNFAKGQTIPNAVTVKVGAGDQISFANAVGATHVIVDIVGYYDDVPGGRFNPVNPTRLLDSRTGKGFIGKVAAGAPRSLQVTAGFGGPVPTTARAVVLNVTVTGGSADSFLTVYPGLQPVPTASNLNFATGQTTANLVTVNLSDSGTVNVANAVGSVHVVADVVGYFDPTKGDLYHSVAPTRMLDSRGPTGGWLAPLTAATPKALTVTGGAVRSDATAVVANTTVTASTAPSYLTVQPTGAGPATTSNINFAAGQTIPNLVVTQLGPNGQITFRTNTGSTHVIFDLVGWYAPT